MNTETELVWRKAADVLITPQTPLNALLSNPYLELLAEHIEVVLEWAENEWFDKKDARRASVDGISDADRAGMHIHLVAFTALCNHFEEQRRAPLPAEERAFISRALAIFLEIARMPAYKRYDYTPMSGIFMKDRAGLYHDRGGEKQPWLLEKLATLKRMHRVPFPAWSGPLGQA